MTTEISLYQSRYQHQYTLDYFLSLLELGKKMLLEGKLAQSGNPKERRALEIALDFNLMSNLSNPTSISPNAPDTIRR